MRYFSPVGAILLVISSIAAVVGVVIVLNYANVTNVGYGVIPFAETATEYAAATTPPPAPSPSPAPQAGSCTYSMNSTSYTIAGSGVTAQTCADALAKISAGAPSPSPTATPSATPSPTPVPSASMPAFVCLYSLPDGSTVTVSNTSITDVASCVAYAVKQLTPSTAPAATPMPSMSTTPSPTDSAPASSVPASSAPPADLAKCPTAFQASKALVVSGRASALVNEGAPPAEYCLFEYRAAAGEPPLVTCKDGWTCTLDTKGANGYVFSGGNKTFELDPTTMAVSFRLVDAYPADDPVHDPCRLLANEQKHIDETSPESGFLLLPGNFSCQALKDPVAPPSGIDTSVCPASASDVSAWVGGLASEWSRLNDHQWKRMPNSLPAVLMAPWGTLDWWDGHNAHDADHGNATPAGQKVKGAYEATWNCK